MHPLSHPRNAIFVGIVCVVIGVRLLGRPVRWRLAHRLAGGDDARRARHRDGAHVLRPHRRLAERLGGRPARPMLAQTSGTRSSSSTSQFVIPDWGALIALLPVFLARPRRRVLRAGRDPRTRRPGRPGAPGTDPPVTPAGVHMPGPLVAPILAASGASSCSSGSSSAGPSLIARAGRARPLAPRTGAARRCATTTTSPASTTTLPAVVHEGPPPGRPHARPVVPAAPRLARRSRSCSAASCSAAGCWSSGCSSRRDAPRLAGRRTEEYRKVDEADQTGHLENIPAPALAQGDRCRSWPSCSSPRRASTPAGSRRASASGGGDGGASPGCPRAVRAARRLPGRHRRSSPGRSQFDDDELTAPADKPFTITFDNRGCGHPPRHRHPRAAQVEGLRRARLPGARRSDVYDVPRSPPATYTFICSIHPAVMTGELTVGG